MLVLDANILVRAVLGTRVVAILEKHSAHVRFFAPDTAFLEAKTHLPSIISKKGIDPEMVLSALARLRELIEIVDSELYGSFESTARKRLRARDENDWPVLATALALKCAIWTEDADLFGAGVATWTTDRIELSLTEPSP